MIDREKLRHHARRLEPLSRLMFLERAVDLVADDKLLELVKGRIPLEELEVDETSSDGLLARAQRFHRESLEGDYYASFMVSSRNCTSLSSGTQWWIAEAQRILSQCKEMVAEGLLAEARAVFELIFDLLIQIDEGEVEIIFFGDEAGSWQVGVDWLSVLPAWFRSLAPFVKPKAYAEAVHGMIGYFMHYAWDELLTAAMDEASLEQVALLAELPPPSKYACPPSFLHYEGIAKRCQS